MCRLQPLTATTLHFLRVNAQMHNLDKQKTACSRQTLAVSTTDMTRQILTILLLTFLLNSLGQTSQKCSCSAIIDTEYKGDVLLFKNPNGENAQKLRHNLKDEDFLVLKIIKDSSDFFFVDISYSIKDNTTKRGWIKKFDKIGTYARNYSNTLQLYSNPNSKSKVQTIVSEYIPELYIVKKCSDKWVFVTINYKGQSFSGWLHPDKQCANPYSTCN